MSIFQRDLLPTVRLRRSLAVGRSRTAHHVTLAWKLLSCFHATSVDRFSPKLMDKAADQIQQIWDMIALAQEKSRQWVLSMREVTALVLEGPKQQEESQIIDGTWIVFFFTF